MVTDFSPYVRRFEREIQPYAEPISVEELREGEIYFSLQFADNELLIPSLRPLIFIGRNLTPGDTQEFYFQDFESYSNGVGRGDRPAIDSAAFITSRAETLHHIFAFDKALDGLLRCALARERAGMGDPR
jgi:hypothetical protein